MPRVAASNGIRPEIRALSVIKLNVPVTPAEINKAVGTGNYAAKYITFLRRAGFEFTTQKDGKSVATYTLIKEPDNAATLRSASPVVVAAVKKVDAPKAKVKSKSNFNRPPVKAKVKAAKKDAFGNDALTGEVATYATDYDYDEPAPTLRDLGLDSF